MIYLVCRLSVLMTVQLWDLWVVAHHPHHDSSCLDSEAHWEAVWVWVWVCLCGIWILCLTFAGRETLPCVWDLTVEKERLCLVHLHLLGQSQWHCEVGPEWDLKPCLPVKKQTLRIQWFFFSFRVKKVSGTSTTKCWNSRQLGGLSSIRTERHGIPHTVLGMQCQAFGEDSKALERDWIDWWTDEWIDGWSTWRSESGSRLLLYPLCPPIRICLMNCLLSVHEL